MNTVVTKILMGLAYVILAPVIGGLLEGLDRKISARMQRRVGPPLLQPFYDVGKLLHKQTINVVKSQSFLMMSYLLFMVITGVMFFIGTDILMCMFVMSTAAMFLYFAATVTSSPYSTIGASRELIQIMAYEPAVLLTCVGFYIVRKTFEVESIIKADDSAIKYLPGVFVAFVFVLTIKMRKSPFDISTSHHANQEVIKGVTAELGAKNLAFFQICEWYENVLLMGIIGLFVINSNPLSIPVAIAVILLVYFLEILIDNCSARMKYSNMLFLAWTVTLIASGCNIWLLMMILK